MRLAPKAAVVEVWRSATIWALLIAIAIGALLYVPGLQIPIVVGIFCVAVIAILVEVAWLTPTAVKNFRYSISSDGVSTSAGVIFKRTTFIPMQQILIVERRQGPIMRPYGLVKIRLRVPGSYVDIDGVTDDAFLDLQREVHAAHTPGDHG